MNEEYPVKHFDVNFSDCRYVGELYQELKRKLKLPDWCGENLDALYDILTEEAEPVRLTLLLPERFSPEMEAYWPRLRRVLDEAEEANPAFCWKAADK